MAKTGPKLVQNRSVLKSDRTDYPLARSKSVGACHRPENHPTLLCGALPLGRALDGIRNARSSVNSIRGAPGVWSSRLSVFPCLNDRVPGGCAPILSARDRPWGALESAPIEAVMPTPGHGRNIHARGCAVNGFLCTIIYWYGIATVP